MEAVLGESFGIAAAAVIAARSRRLGVLELTPEGLLGPSPVKPVADGAGAAVIPAAVNASRRAGDCCPKCAVLGRENIESSEPELAMVPGSISLRLITCFQVLTAIGIR